MDKLEQWLAAENLWLWLTAEAAYQESLTASVDPAVAAAPAETAEMFRTFTDQPLWVMGEETTDNRILAEDGVFTQRDFPMPLQWCEKSEGGHINSVTVGVLESHRQDGNRHLYSGYMLNNEHSEKAANLLAHKVASPSADMGKSEWHYTDENGRKLDSNEAIMAHLEKGGSLRRKITQGHVVGATLVAFPAIGSARLELNPEREVRDVGLVAAAAAEFSPRVYPHAHFEDPGFTRSTPLHMDENGRISGHLATFGECHSSVQSSCVMVPRSPSGYQRFHTSPPVRLDDGKRLQVGRLTVGTGHADPRLRPAPAAAHYDNTGACFALVVAGEDAFGVWVSGVAAPWATTEQIEQGLSSPLSGDWRNFGQGLDLVAVLAVNTPGFAVQGSDDDEGYPSALVASLSPQRNPRAVLPTRDDIRAWIKEALVELSAEAVPEEPAAPEPEPVPEVAPQRAAADATTQAETESGKSLAEQAEELLVRAGF